MNLSGLKVIYFLVNNIKSKHKLTDLNYNLMAILSQIIQTGVLDYGTPILMAFVVGFSTFIAVKSHKFI